MSQSKYYPEIYSFIPGSLISVSASLSTELRYAKPEQLKDIEYLRKTNGKELGFIPLSCYQSIVEKSRINDRDRWKSNNLVVCIDNDDVTGFCFASFYQSTHTEIIQICVREDARRMERALLMADFIEHKSRAIKKPGIRARVACDIEAVNFWKAIGYEIEDTTVSSYLNRKPSKNQRPIYIFYKSLDYSSNLLRISSENS